MPGITRERIIEALRAAIEPLEFVHSLYEGGSEAFGRTDEYSDIDLGADIDDGRDDEVYAAVEEALTRLAPIEQRFIVPTPAWHGMTQRFYRLAGTSEWLLVDLHLRPRSKAGLFSEVEQHGRQRIYFDKIGAAEPRPLDADELRESMRKRLELLRARHWITEGLCKKEILRGDILCALHCYRAYIIDPLVEVLRMRHDPARYTFGMRYLTYDMPAEPRERLEELCLVASAEELMRKQESALAWLAREMADLDIDAATAHL